MPHYITPVQRLALQICKRMRTGTPICREELRADLGQQDFDKATDLALSNGWLRLDDDGRFSLTTQGDLAARRSRVGRHKTRTYR